MLPTDLSGNFQMEDNTLRTLVTGIAGGPQYRLGTDAAWWQLRSF